MPRPRSLPLPIGRRCLPNPAGLNNRGSISSSIYEKMITVLNLPQSQGLIQDTLSPAPTMKEWPDLGYGSSSYTGMISVQLSPNYSLDWEPGGPSPADRLNRLVEQDKLGLDRPSASNAASIRHLRKSAT